MNHCRDCKHYTPPDQIDTELWEESREEDPGRYGNGEPFGTCELARSSNGKSKSLESLAVAQDGESYFAKLTVSPHFGCIQFETV